MPINDQAAGLVVEFVRFPIRRVFVMPGRLRALLEPEVFGETGESVA